MYDDVTYTVDPQHIEGEMTIGTKQKSTTLGEPEFNTLDEPIRDTIVSVYCYILLLQFQNLFRIEKYIFLIFLNLLDSWGMFEQ